MRINLKTSRLKGKRPEVESVSKKNIWRFCVLTAGALLGVVWGTAFSYSPYWLVGTTLTGAFLGGLSQYNCTIGRIFNDILWLHSIRYRWYPPSGLVISGAILFGLVASIFAAFIILEENFFWLEMPKHVKTALPMLIIGTIVGHVIYIYRRKLLFIANEPWASKTDKFVEAAKENNIDQMSILLEKGVNINAKEIRTDFTALIAAAYYGRKEVVQFLIAKGANVNKREKINYSTPLIVAAQQGYANIANILIASGAKINNIYGNGVSEEDSVAGGGRYKNIQRLLYGGYGQKSNYDRTPLMMAACGGHIETVKLLLENSVDINDKSSEGKTAAMYAKESGYLNIVELLDQN